MRYTPARTGFDSKKRRLTIARVESLEARSLLSGLVFHSPAGSSTVDVSTNPPVATVASVATTDSPRVAYAQFEPLTGRILVQFTADSAGYDPSVLTNPANYTFSVIQTPGKLPKATQAKPKPGIVLAPAFEVTGVTLTTPLEPGQPPSVVVSINNNEPLRSGSYRFAIQAGGIDDLAGRPLEGDFTGTFPSDGGPSGANFVAVLAETHNTVIPALSTHPSSSSTGTAPAYVFLPTTHQIEVRYTSATPGQFMLAGGNNLTLKPLKGQHFPGTYRLAKLAPSKLPHGLSGKTP